MRYQYSADGLDMTEVEVLEGGVWKDLLILGSYVNHRPQTITDASGLTRTIGYNSRGQVKSVVVRKDVQSETTKYSYDLNLDGQPDENGYLIKVERTDPANAGQFVTLAMYTYDSARRVRTATDESGYTLTYDYDNFDRVTLVTHPDSTTEQRDYENLHLNASKDRGGLWHRYAYNSLIQLVAEQDPQGRLTQYQWCKCGAISALIDPLQQITRWKRDEQGRVMYKTLPDGTTKTSLTYQPLSGRLSTITQPNDQAGGNPTVTYRYALAGQRISEDFTDANTPDVSLSYSIGTAPNVVPDPLGRLRSMTDGIGAGVTNYTYHPLMGSVAGAGKLLAVNGPWDDDTVRYSYDWQNRLNLREIVADNDTVLRSEGANFDSLGRRTQAVNNLGTFTYNYGAGNLSGRVASISGPNSLLTSFSYFPLSATGAKALSLQGITHTRGGTAVSAFGYDYDASGRITTWTQQASTTPANTFGFGYNRSSELIEAVLKDSGGAVLQNYSYRYDAAGNRYVSGSGSNSEHRQHNVLNQLTQRGGAGATLVEGTVDEPSTVTVNSQAAQVVPMPGSGLWKYEKSIPVSVGQNTATVTATDASGNIRTSNYQFTVGAAQPALIYDLNGNLTSDGTRTFTWDAKNRLKSVAVGGMTYAWDYDGMDRRVVEKTNGVETARWVWDATELVQQRTSANAVAKNYYREGEQWIGGPNAGSYYVTRDHLRSVRELLDTTGSVRARYSYDPYGVVTKVGGDMDGEFAYTGHRYHITAGLHLAPYRAYAAELGRWLSRDPIEEKGGLNLYRYVHNLPITKVDPDGLLDFVIGGEADLVPIIGGEVSLCIVVDFDTLLDSGINLAGGLGGGANAGVAWTAGLFGEAEGTSLNADINAGAIGLTGNWDLPSGAFNGGAISVGPGGGASLTCMKSGTLSVGDVINWIRGLFK